MRKRVLSWVLAATLAAGTLVSSVPSYAAEETHQSALSVSGDSTELGNNYELSEDLDELTKETEKKSGEDNFSEGKNESSEGASDEKEEAGAQDSSEVQDSSNSEASKNTEEDLAADDTSTGAASDEAAEAASDEAAAVTSEITDDTEDVEDTGAEAASEALSEEVLEETEADALASDDLSEEADEADVLDTEESALVEEEFVVDAGSKLLGSSSSNEKEAVITKLYLMNASTGDMISDKTTVQLEKGKTLTVFTRTYWTTSNVNDSTEVLFESSDPKAVSVDSLGNCKALKAGEKVTITVTSKALKADGKPAKSSFIIETTESAKLVIKNAKFENATYNFTYSGAKETATLVIAMDKDVDCDITVYSSDCNVVGPNYKMLVEKSTGRVTIDFDMVKPGQATVTASIGGVKTISCVVNVLGSAGSGLPYFYNGKYLTGFWGFDEFDMPLAAGIGALKKAGVKYLLYFDPVTYVPVSGRVITVGKKMYLMGDDYKLVTDNSSDQARSYFIGASGELLTGWQKDAVSGGQAYYSPDDGKKVVSSWVLKGKGYTWVNKDGLMLDANGKTLSDDGLHKIDAGLGTQTFCFKGGLRQTGLVYFGQNGTITAANKGAFAGYFDTDDGAMAIDRIVLIGAKQYCCDVNTGRITINGRFSYKGNSYISDKTGAMIIGPKLYKQADGNYCYVDENGIIAKNKYVSSGNKLYYCGSDGTVENRTVGVMDNYYKAVDQPLGSVANAQKVYTKSANVKNASTGLVFFYDPECTKKVTNHWLYTSAGTYAYLDASGALVRGIKKVKEGTFYFNPETGELWKNSGNIVITYNGKRYALNKDGQVFTTPGFEKINSSTYVRVKDSSGVLMTGMQTIKGRKYLFSPDGNLIKPNYGMITGTNAAQIYLANPEATDAPETWYVYAPGKTILAGAMLFDKSGYMITNGWATVDGKKYLASGGMVMSDDNGMVKYGGKWYTFGASQEMLTGWQKITNPYYTDVDTFTESDSSGTFYFYFNEKTGALETGWKNMNTPSGVKRKIYLNATASDKMPLGALAINMDLTIGGKLYRFDGDGGLKTGNEGMVNINPSDTVSGGTSAYLKADGTIAKGRTLVKTSYGNKYYYFSQTDGTKETNVLRKTGSKWYYYGDNGQQATTARFTEIVSLNSAPYHMAFAVFNKDGSVKCFVRADGSNVPLKNCRILGDGSEESYWLGANGLPFTGIVDDKVTGSKHYVETDGRNGGSYNSSSTDYQLIKSGNKFYMLRGGILLSYSNVKNESVVGGLTKLSVTEGMFDLLPSADRKEILRLFGYNRVCYLGAGNDPIMYLNPDGSVYVGKTSLNGKRVFTNKYGIVKDSISYFVNDGGWKLSAAKAPALSSRRSETIKVFDMSKMNGFGADTERYLLLTWDLDRNVSVKDADTGAAVTGDFWITSSNFQGVFIKVKNGKLITGKVVVNYSGRKVSLNIDKDYGIYTF